MSGVYHSHQERTYREYEVAVACTSAPRGLWRCNMGHRFRHLVAIAVLAILAACGGMPDDSVVPTPPPATAPTALPPSRSASQPPMATVAPLPTVTPASIAAATSAAPSALPTNL